MTPLVPKLLKQENIYCIIISKENTRKNGIYEQENVERVIPDHSDNFRCGYDNLGYARKRLEYQLDLSIYRRMPYGRQRRPFREGSHPGI